ncbi:hypothetical protein CYMTET_54709 [Cymbomonas tetramitiformis]|uniref:Uncharacterized protein n=1 Tax=Cymbomonas tetramitiformis TaxID=36881 RepID=A0AAE0BEP4_9CHLO|nr:hypothetical protein CYMTET_54709 [Cymbomonas tetramitiformis]
MMCELALRSAELDLSSFEFDDLAKKVIPKVNELLYDTFAYIVKSDSAAEHFLLGTDSVSDRDGRRALLDLIKGWVPPGLTTRLEKIEAAIKFQKAGGTTGVPSLSAIVAAERGRGRIEEISWLEGIPVRKGGKSAAGGTAAYCMPADGEGADEAMHTLALCQIFQVAADDGSEAFAAAVAEYGAPAVLAGGESDGIDVSAYGLAVSDDSGSGVMSELENLTGQVRAMWAKVGVHLSHVSLLGNDDVREHPAPVVRPLRLITTAYRPRISPVGVELVPVQHCVPSMTIEPLISAVACSYEPATKSFVEPADACEHYDIDEFMAGSETDGLGQSESETSFVETLYGQSANRSQQVMGCGTPPPGLRPDFVLLVYVLGLLGIGFTGATGIGGATGSGMPAAEAQPTAVPPPGYWRPEGHYASGYSPHGWT